MGETRQRMGHIMTMSAIAVQLSGDQHRNGYDMGGDGGSLVAPSRQTGTKRKVGHFAAGTGRGTSI